MFSAEEELNTRENQCGLLAEVTKGTWVDVVNSCFFYCNDYNNIIRYNRI